MAEHIYRTPKSPFWQYDFVLHGRRFSGSTRARRKDIARRFVDDLRNRAILGGETRRHVMTVGQAVGRYWHEHGQHRRGAGTLLGQLHALKAGIGEHVLLSEIGNDAVTAYVGRRRVQVAPGRTAPPGPATINRELAILRALVRRARKLWKVDTGTEPDWTDLALAEPAQRKRYLSAAEEQALVEALPSDLRPMVAFSLLTGCRLASAYRLRWSDVTDVPGSIEFRDMKSSRDDETHQLPLTPELRALLDGLRGQHPDRVFSYAARHRRGERAAGTRLPFTKDGWRKAWAAALDAAGIRNFRWHDLRHTAATRLLSATGNLAMTQQMLGHASIITTRRYAHTLTEDLAKGMSMMASRNSPGKETTRVAALAVQSTRSGT